MSETTVRDLIDSCRVRHPAFTHEAITDGSVIKFANSRQRTLVGEYGEQVEGLLTTSVQVAIVNASNILVGVDANGVPQFLTTYEDGWTVKVDGNGVPYFDFTTDPITTDPFGEHGGTPGFPLPSGLIKLTAATAQMRGGQTVPVDVFSEGDRRSRPNDSRPAAFINGSRLVPLREEATKSYDRWTLVSAVGISYVGLTTIATLDQVLEMPDVLMEALEAGVLEMMAMSARGASPRERKDFADAARRSEAALFRVGDSILSDLAPKTIQYRG